MNKYTFIGSLLIAAAISGTAIAADQVKQVDLENAKLSYTDKRMWFSLPWGGPRFARPLSFEYADHASRLEAHLKAAGFETEAASGIRLEIIEDYAGKIADYHQPVIYEGPKANGLQVAGELAIAALLSKFGLFSPSQVGMSAAANSTASTVNSLGRTITPPNIGNPAHQVAPGENAPEMAGDTLLVVLRVCSAASKQCVEAAAISTGPMTLDDLRRISIDEGVMRALGLAPGPITSRFPAPPTKALS